MADHFGPFSEIRVYHPLGRFFNSLLRPERWRSDSFVVGINREDDDSPLVSDVEQSPGTVSRIPEERRG
jgi:hypothetical protein